VSADLGRVVVLAGGLSHERDVSLRSGRRVVDGLFSAGVEADLLDTDGQLLSALSASPPEAVFVALHGSAGETGAVQGVLELLGLPYVGSAPAACRLAWDKPSAKAMVHEAGIATPDYVALPHTTFRELGAVPLLDRIVERLGMPLMVKPATGGSALGAQAVGKVDDLPEAMVSCFSYADTALVECFVEGTEVAVTVLETDEGPQALPAVEIAPVDGVFDYSARYTAGATRYFAPARLDPAVAEVVAATALSAHSVLGLRDLSRTDLLVDPDGQVHFLEVNVAPGMTETSLLPMAVAAAGHDLGSVCHDLLVRAVERGPGGVAGAPA
jgi:D-alanine-D-alanine ligase